MRIIRSLVFSLSFALLLPACSSIQPATTLNESARASLYDQRYDQLSALTAWSMVGRLAISNEKEGGSGHFNWQQNSADSRMDFHGALGRGAWKLTANESGAELQLADGTVHSADSVEQLVRVQVGWEIPVDNLSWWVRGLAAPGEIDERAIDERGNLRELVQDGWVIEYGKYKVFEGVNLPSRLTARQDDWRVKLAIRNWELAEEKAVNE